MALISLCMIVKNEEEVLERCLLSVKNLVDEIIIVDTGSTDKTCEIAKKFTNNIYNFDWCNDFSKARNFAFSKAKCNYIMWLDADDVIPKKSLKKLLELKQNLTSDVYMLKYDIAFLNNKPSFSYYRERILKNCKECFWQGVVHECIVPFGKVEKIDICIEHRKIKHECSDRNLKIYKNLEKQRPLNAREKYYYGRELFDHKKYNKCKQILTEFVNDTSSWIENVIESYIILSECYKNLNKQNMQYECLAKTLQLTEPRANICCKLGDYFLSLKQYKSAIFWFVNAPKCENFLSSGGFIENTYYNYYPYMQLCYIYYLLGDNKKAARYNNLAGKFYKTSAYFHNKKFFDSLQI